MTLAIEARRRLANAAGDDDHYHTVANPSKGEPAGERGLPNKGYRPGRKTARRQDQKRKRKGGGSARNATHATTGSSRRVAQ